MVVFSSMAHLHQNKVNAEWWKKQDPFSMAIENVKLCHEYCSQNSWMGTVRVELYTAALLSTCSINNIEWVINEFWQDEREIYMYISCPQKIYTNFKNLITSVKSKAI